MQTHVCMSEKPQTCVSFHQVVAKELDTAALPLSWLKRSTTSAETDNTQLHAWPTDVQPCPPSNQSASTRLYACTVVECMIMDGGHQAAVMGASGTIPIAAENGAADEALARTPSSSSSSSSSDETSQDPWVPIAAGGAAGATRTLSAPLSRALANLFRNPLRWFRPTHAGIGIVVSVH